MHPPLAPAFFSLFCRKTTSDLNGHEIVALFEADPAKGVERVHCVMWEC